MSLKEVHDSAAIETIRQIINSKQGGYRLDNVARMDVLHTMKFGSGS